jgi:thymidylate synthase
MQAYLDIVRKVLDKGELKKTRTGESAYTVAGAMFEHDMADGFPLLTTKKMPFRLISSELEFFIKGLTDKRWLNERNNHIWDEWASPIVVSYGHDKATLEAMAEEYELGPIYGWQWRHWGAKYEGCEADYTGKGIDQLEKLVSTLKTNPNDRRMIVNAWNPSQINEMALPPCHYSFQVIVINGKLDLLWNQRSVDTMLGLPFNISSYGLLLHLLAKESGLEEGRLVGFLADVHIYENHVDGAERQVMRTTFPLPRVETPDFTSIFDWQYKDTKLVGYESNPKLEFQIAV